MIKPYRNQQTLFIKLDNWFHQELSVYSDNPHLVQAVSQLNANMHEIFVLAGETDRRKALSTETKADTKNELVKALLNYRAMLLTWFLHSPDPESPMETRLSPSQIRYAPDAQLLLIGAKTYEYVQANLAALAAYGFTAPMQTGLNNAIAAFETLSDKPRREFNNRKIKREALKAAIEKTRKLVREDITIYVGTYEFTNPTFYGTFKILAKLGKEGNRTMALRVSTTTTAGLPLPRCTVSVQAATGKPIIKMSGKSGMLKFQHLPHELCSITCLAPDGISETKEVEIKASERADVVFVF